MDASEPIDKKIAELGDWRGERIAQIRHVVASAAPDLKEEWKWNTGVWTYKGKIVCGWGAFKEHVKINFFKGIHLPDPSGFLNGNATGKENRSADLREDNTLDEAALTAVVKAAVAYSAKT